ncbi:NifU homolog involved in Fe-S cluster formation [Aliiroseovarius crassostreae]|uniref:Nitrogen fixation protein NifU n=1 Tax=Aliiroseovarius crassostreae TaxID=154981 RepID=A0A0P7J4C6_9RHOB|nr:iron-sulfur cluster assembly scaffold protein [Aliiroseovarius crassostreae]KPN62534.1 nitrogen fixation protein NifU [Aliiroseovarius crassostreae]SFU91625.1 NifU homolog involved in Fe-S cluster formation [Aliiroseovarius crassostreae]
MSDSDLIKLYSKQILALASQIPHVGQLTTPEGEAKVRSPLCGSTVSAQVVMKNGKVADFAQNVKACALGQTSAALLGKVVIGLEIEVIQRGRDQLAAMLRDQGPVPAPPFEGFEVLIPARDYRNRHASILLAFDAVLQAIENSAES